MSIAYSIMVCLAYLVFQTYLVVTCDKGSESAPNAEQQDEHPSSENNTNGTVDNTHT